MNFDSVKAGIIRGKGASPDQLNAVIEEVTRQSGIAVGSGEARRSPAGLLLSPETPEATCWCRFKTGVPNSSNLYEGYLLSPVGMNDPIVWDDGQEREIWLAQAGADPTKTVSFPIYSQGNTFYRFPAVPAGQTQDTGGDYRDLFLFEPYSYSTDLYISSGTPNGDGLYSGSTLDGSVAVWVALIDGTTPNLPSGTYAIGLFKGTATSGGTTQAKFVIPPTSATKVGWGVITGHSGGTGNVWSYTMNIEGGPSGVTATNGAELPNVACDGTTIQGNGAKCGTLGSATVTMQPITTGTGHLVFIKGDGSGGNTYRFSSPNGVTCS